MIAPTTLEPGVPGKQNLQAYWWNVTCSPDFQGRNAFYYTDCDEGDSPEWGVFGLDGVARIEFGCGPV